MKRSTLFLLGMVVALALVIFLWEKKQPSTAQMEADASKLFPVFPEKTVTIERTGDAPVLLEQAKDEWRIKSPLEDPADKASVEGFLEALKGAQASRMIEKGASPASLGLAPAKTQVAIKGEKGEKLLLGLGDKPPLEEGLYFMAGDKTGIIGDYLIDTIKKGVNDFRSRELAAPLKPEEVKSAAYVRNGKTVVSLEKRDGGWFVTAPYEDEADLNKAYQFVEDVVLWPVMTFEDDMADLSFAGLFSPGEKIELTTSGGAKITVSIGNMKDPEKNFCYASVSNRKGMFVVSKNSVRMLGKDPEEFRSLSVFSADLYGADKIEISAKAPVVLENVKDKGWQVAGQKGREEDARTVVYSLSGLQAEKLLQPGQKGTPLAVASVLSKSGKTVIRFFEDAGTIYAERDGRKALARLTKDDGERLKASLIKLEEKKK